MTSLTTPKSSSAYNTKLLCLIVGLACLAGFLVDTVVLLFPPLLNNIEWRLSFMQQLGDRSIILLFGLALLMVGIIDIRSWRKNLALFCLVLGIALGLSSIMVIRDSIELQQTAFTNIEKKASEIQEKIQQAQANPATSPKISPDQIRQASALLENQAETLKQNAKVGALKTRISGVGNLIVVALAFLGLGRYGLQPPRD
jgi:hypothetical protein